MKTPPRAGFFFALNHPRPAPQPVQRGAAGGRRALRADAAAQGAAVPGQAAGLAASAARATFTESDRKPLTMKSSLSGLALLLALTLAAYALAMTIGRGDFGTLNLVLLGAAALGAGLFLLAEQRAVPAAVLRRDQHHQREGRERTARTGALCLPEPAGRFCVDRTGARRTHRNARRLRHPGRRGGTAERRSWAILDQRWFRPKAWRAAPPSGARNPRPHGATSASAAWTRRAGSPSPSPASRSF